MFFHVAKEAPEPRNTRTVSGETFKSHYGSFQSMSALHNHIKIWRFIFYSCVMILIKTDKMSLSIANLKKKPILVL